MTHENEQESPLRFVRCGRGESWRDANLTRNEIHFGWSKIPHQALQRKDRDELKDCIVREYAVKRYKNESARRTAISNSLRELLDALNPHGFTWITIAHGKLWWCTAKPGLEFCSETETNGHFFARCHQPWSDHSRTAQSLDLKSLPKSVSVMSR